MTIGELKKALSEIPDERTVYISTDEYDQRHIAELEVTTHSSMKGVVMLSGSKLYRASCKRVANCPRPSLSSVCVGCPSNKMTDDEIRSLIEKRLGHSLSVS